jgi:hypothetical protein
MWLSDWINSTCVNRTKQGEEKRDELEKINANKYVPNSGIGIHACSSPSRVRHTNDGRSATSVVNNADNLSLDHGPTNRGDDARRIERVPENCTSGPLRTFSLHHVLFLAALV